MYVIADYDKRYRPYDKSGGELRRADWVKLPVNPKGDGLQKLLKHKRGLEVFAVWTLLLEKTTAEKKPENRGKLLNHQELPASPVEIANGISLPKKEGLVAYALSVLTTMGWLKNTGESEQPSVKLPQTSAKSSVVKSSVVKSSVVKSREHKEGKFVPPTIEQAEKYAKSIGFQLNGAKFVSHYEANGWMRGKTKIRDWKAAVRYWKSTEKDKRDGIRNTGNKRAFADNLR